MGYWKALEGEADKIFYSLLIPPLMGFFAKQFVLFSAIQSGYYFISIVAIIVSVISASYYLKVIRFLYSTSSIESDLNVKTNPIVALAAVSVSSNANTKKDEIVKSVKPLLPTGQSELKNNNNNNYESIITSSHSFLISTLTLSILFFVLKPSILLNSTQILSLSIFYF